MFACGPFSNEELVFGDLMNNSPAAGDVVQLKSGGPRMTVRSSVSGDSDIVVYCQWFVADKLESGAFPIASLVSVPPGTSPIR